MKLDKSYSMPSLVNASRDNIIGPLMIDFAERDVENGKKNLNIIIFLSPDGGPPEKYEEAIKKTCIEIFRTRDCIDLIWRDETSIQRVMGLPRPVQLFNNWFIEVQHPRSSFFNISSLETYFMAALRRNMNGI